MSIRLMEKIWRDSKYVGGLFLVLLALADFANDDGICFPSVPTIAKKARLSDRQVYTVLRQFREDGILSVLNPGGGRDCSTYRLNFTPEITSGQPCSPLQGTPEICSSVYKEEPSYNRQGSRQKKESSRKTSIPGDFTISPRVRAWATTKGYSLPRGTS